MSKILVATHNVGKIKEIWALLNEIPAELVAPDQLSLDLAVKETGSTYAGERWPLKPLPTPKLQA